tara:strand:+ start:5890 stop:7059 length:1170 start_codon:yes stop_codon:yes gene_type:complete
MAQVGNKNIDNASGQVVRLDIQNTIKAVTTNNFGPRNDAGTILPCEFLADDTTNKLLIRKSSGGDQANPNPTSGTAATFFSVGNLDEENLGLLPKAGGTMTGQILGDDGSAAGSPAYSFDNDTDTGMFRSGANTIGFSTAGVARASISDAGLDITNGLPLRLQDSSGAPFVALKSPSSLSANVTLTLPSNDGNSGEFLQTDGSGALSFSAVQGVPIGSVFCIAHTSVPSGYLECNGDPLPNGTGTVQGKTANYAPLRNLVGANLPDLRGEFIRGFDNGRGVDTGRNMLQSQSDQNEAHTHSFSANTANVNISGTISRISESFNSSGSASGVFSKQTGFSASNTPGRPDSNDAGQVTLNSNHAHSFSGTTGSNGGESRPRNIAMMYIIKF